MAGSLVFTNEKCIGCNKCISACSAMGACVSSVMDGKPRIDVDGSRCITCGACIDACEHEAREFCDDTERFFADLKRGERISILLAPAFKANYPNEYEKVLGGLKKLGVNRIISISFGADICTWGYLNYIKKYNRHMQRSHLYANCNNKKSRPANLTLNTYRLTLEKTAPRQHQLNT